MRIVGLVFSARRAGNGFKCMKYCLERMEQKGFRTVLVNAYDYEITPCSHCDYECYAKIIRGKMEECPIEDDVPELYRMMKAADYILFALPTYGGRLPAIFQAFRERSSGLNHLFKDFEEYQRSYLNKIKGIIVIGNLTAGGDMSLHEVLSDFYNIKQPDAVLLQANEYGRSSLKGDLIEVKAVKETLDRFSDRIMKSIGKNRVEDSV